MENLHVALCDLKAVKLFLVFDPLLVVANIEPTSVDLGSLDDPGELVSVLLIAFALALDPPKAEASLEASAGYIGDRCQRRDETWY
jgi:hypothetical protein